MLTLVTLLASLALFPQQIDPYVVGTVDISAELNEPDFGDWSLKLTQNTRNGDILVSWIHEERKNNSLYIKLLKYDKKGKFKNTTSKKITSDVQFKYIESYDVYYNEDLNSYIFIYASRIVNENLFTEGVLYTQKVTSDGSADEGPSRFFRNRGFFVLTPVIAKNYPSSNKCIFYFSQGPVVTNDDNYHLAGLYAGELNIDDSSLVSTKIITNYLNKNYNSSDINYQTLNKNHGSIYDDSTESFYIYGDRWIDDADNKKKQEAFIISHKIKEGTIKEYSPNSRRGTFKASIKLYNGDILFTFVRVAMHNYAFRRIVLDTDFNIVNALNRDRLEYYDIASSGQIIQGGNIYDIFGSRSNIMTRKTSIESDEDPTITTLLEIEQGKIVHFDDMVYSEKHGLALLAVTSFTTANDNLEEFAYLLIIDLGTAQNGD
jgi:hypothetical protein